LLVCCVAAPVSGQTTDESRLTVVQAVERALAAYPSIRTAEARGVEALAAVREAETAGRPTLDLWSQATQHQKPTVVSPIHGFTLDTAPPFEHLLFQTWLSGTYTLFDGGRQDASVAHARSAVDEVATETAAARQEVMARVVATYARVLSRHQVLLAHESRLTALGAERTRVEQRLEVGRAARLEILRTSAAVAGAEADRVRFAEALDTAERELARLIGADPGATRARQLVAFDLSQPPGDRAQFLEVALARNPGVASARQRVATADTAIVLADTTRQPRVSLTGRLTDFGSAVGHFTNEWSTGVQLAYPLLDGGAARTRVARAQAGRDVARARLRLATTDVGTSLDRTLSAAREADARATSLGAAIAQFEEITRIEQLRLDEGVGTLTDYLLAEAELLGARAGLVEARYATLAARVELARVTGQLELPWLRQYLRTAS